MWRHNLTSSFILVLIALASVYAQEAETPSANESNSITNSQICVGLLSILIGFELLFLGYTWKKLTTFITAFSLLGIHKILIIQG